MKKTIKLSLFAAGCCLSLGLCAGLGLIKHNSGVAVAETPLITMVNGAAVRLPDKTLDNGYSNCGIRFSSIIDKTGYENLKENNDVTSGTFILPWPSYSANPVNEVNCFAEATAKYYWQIGVDSEGAPVYNTTQTEGKTLIYHSESVPELDGDNYRLNGSAVNLGDADMTGVRFVGVGYVKYTSETETNYEFATTSETNARSVAEVAQKLYYKTDAVTADDKTLSDGQKDDLALAYVQKYIDLYHEANGNNPTVEYTLNVNMETSKGFEGVEVQSVAELDSYDAKLPGTQTPIMLDGSSKVSKGYIMNSDKPADAVEVTEDNLLSLGVYNSETAAVTKSSEWSIDGKSESLCIDYSKLSRQNWAGVGEAATPFEWGGGKYMLSFVAYSDKDYVTANAALWYKTNGQEVSYDITLKAGVPQRIAIPVSGSALKLFTFENPQDSTCKLYIDDVYVYSGYFTHEGGILVDPEETLSTLNADDWSFEGKKSFYASNWYDTNVRPGYGWQYSGLNDENKADTVAMIIYIEEDFNSPDAMWMSVFTDYNETQSKSYYLPVDLHKGANYVEFKLADDFVKVSSIQWQKHAMWVDNIQVFNSAKVNRNGRVYAETYVDNNKAIIVAGFTDVITKFSKEVELTISYQTAEDGEWTTLATEASKCALSSTVDLSKLTYCKVKVTATSQGATLATQVIDLIPTV